MTVMELVSDLMPDNRSDIRRGSPNVRHPETSAMSLFSPDSPYSPPGFVIDPVCDGDGYPADLCQVCRGGNFHYLNEWRCSRCYPPEALPKQFIVVPGGTKAKGELQDIERVLRRAAAGTPISMDVLRRALDTADLDDIHHGRITVRNLRAFVATLNEIPDEPAVSVRCIDCAHFRRRDKHPHLGSCSAGISPSGAAGLWDTDRRCCTSFSAVDNQ